MCEAGHPTGTSRVEDGRAAPCLEKGSCVNYLSDVLFRFWRPFSEVSADPPGSGPCIERARER